MANENLPSSENLSQPPQPPLSQKPKDTPGVGVALSRSGGRKHKTLLLILAGIFLTAGLIFTGYQLGQRRQSGLKSSPSETIPTPTSSSLPTSSLIPTTSPTSTSLPSLTSAPDLTVDWKTYTNPKYGYSIKYPSDKSGLVSFACEEGNEYGQGDYKFTWSQPFDLFGLEKLESQGVFCGPRGSSYTIEIRSQGGESIKVDELEGFEGAISQKEKIVVNGVEGIKAVFTRTKPAPIPDKWIEILVFRNGKRYYFILSDITFESIFNFMLPTFKFL